MFKPIFKKLCKALFLKQAKFHNFFIIHRCLTGFLIPEILRWGHTERFVKNGIITAVVQSLWGDESFILAIYYSNFLIAQVSRIKVKDFTKRYLQQGLRSKEIFRKS